MMVQTKRGEGVYMNDRVKEFKKRAAKRKHDRLNNRVKQKQITSYVMKEDEKYGGQTSYTSVYEGGGSNEHPLFHKEVFLFKVLASAILVLVIAIMFKQPQAVLDKPRQFVERSMEESFQFAAFTNWYENQFGDALALFPGTGSKSTNEQTDIQYAVPASSRVMENFETNGQGIMVETDVHAPVTAMNEGWVTFAGNKSDTGTTVILQHVDGSYSWYGQLGSVDVKLFDLVPKGTEVGRTSASEDGTKGVFYFAIQKDDQFIDPTQVISFE